MPFCQHSVRNEALERRETRIAGERGGGAAASEVTGEKRRPIDRLRGRRLSYWKPIGPRTDTEPTKGRDFPDMCYVGIISKPHIDEGFGHFRRIRTLQNDGTE